jgi:hypothetical protein
MHAPATIAPPTVTTLGASAGQSRAFSTRARRSVIAAVAIAILGGAVTWGTLRVVDTESASVPPAAAPARMDASAASNAMSVAPAPVAPAPVALPEVTPDREPADASVAIEASAPDAGAAVRETSTPEPPKHRKPARRAGAKPSAQDGDFVEDRR